MNKLIIAAALVGSLTAIPASAQFYVGAGAGEAKTDGNETSWKVYGGYQFTPYIGLEVGYNDLGRNQGADVETWTLALTGTMPMNESWSLLGEVGASQNRSHFLDANSHTDLLLGLGVGYNFNKNTSVRLLYEEFGKLSDVGSVNNSNGHNLGLSVKYAF